MVSPYTDNGTTRTFLSDVDHSELVWHRDKEDRIVEVLEGEGWMFQYDDHLPVEIEPGDKFFIERMTYHRLLKGTTDLKINIEKRYV